MSLRDQLVQAYKAKYPTWTQGDIELAVQGLEDDKEQMRAKLKQLQGDVIDLTQSPQRDVIDLVSVESQPSVSPSPDPPEALARSVTASPPPPHHYCHVQVQMILDEVATALTRLLRRILLTNDF